MGRYSSGRRGGPAKAVGRATGARVQIPLFPPIETDKNTLINFFRGKLVWQTKHLN